MCFKDYIIAFRFPNVLISIVSMFVYFSYAGGICWTVALSALLFHMSANITSEYRDYTCGVDSKESKGSSKIPLANIGNKKNVYYVGIACFLMAVVFGFFAIHTTGEKILIIPGIIAALFVFFYSERPIGYKYKALGEMGVFTAFGPLLCFSCMFSVVKTCYILVSIPVGLLVACVMIANNIRDYNFDKITKNKTIPTVLGLKNAYGILFTSAHLAYFCLLFMKHTITVWPVFLTYPIMFLSLKYINTSKFFNVFLILLVSFCIVLGACIFVN
jgi:1,4-dihydroxy-2-naphthoate octaprenyltransferase